MMKPLIWKEWHEQRWKLAFGTFMLVFFTGDLLAARLTTDREIVVVAWMLGSFILSLYSAMGVFAPEVTDGTKIFLSSKPVKPWKSFWCKWFFGWLNFAGPILICSAGMTILILLKPDEQLSELKFIAGGALAAIFFGTMFYSMTCCLAPQKSGEAFVGLTGLIVLVAMFVYAMITLTIFGNLRHHQGMDRIFREIISHINPLMWVEWIGNHRSLNTLLIPQGILFIIVILIGLRKWQRSL